MESDEGSSSSVRKSKRREMVEKKKARDELMRAASAQMDHLSSFPPSFRHYLARGLSVSLECGTRGDKLSSSLKHHLQNLLKVNMECAFGPEWPVEEKIKHRDMVSPEARYILLHETQSHCVHNMSTNLEKSGSLVGFLHYRFTIEEDIPVLYVYEIQLESHVQGKGLGNFLMQLIELIARKNHMSAVVLTVQKANVAALNFYMNKLRYTVSRISPSRVDPLMGVVKNYEILCKAFDHGAKAVLE